MLDVDGALPLALALTLAADVGAPGANPPPSPPTPMVPPPPLDGTTEALGLHAPTTATGAAEAGDTTAAATEVAAAAAAASHRTREGPDRTRVSLGSVATSTCQAAHAMGGGVCGTISSHKIAASHKGHPYTMQPHAWAEGGGGHAPFPRTRPPHHHSAGRCRRAPLSCSLPARDASPGDQPQAATCWCPAPGGSRTARPPPRGRPRATDMMPTGSHDRPLRNRPPPRRFPPPPPPHPQSPRTGACGWWRGGEGERPGPHAQGRPWGQRRR